MSETSWIIVGNIIHHTTPVISACRELVEHLARGGITEVAAPSGFVLQTAEKLQPLAIGIEVRHMLGITMTIAGGVKTLTIIINHHRAIHNLVPTVFVNIGHNIVMISLSIPRTACVPTIPTPCFGPLAIA